MVKSYRASTNKIRLKRHRKTKIFNDPNANPDFDEIGLSQLFDNECRRIAIIDDRLNFLKLRSYQILIAQIGFMFWFVKFVNEGKFGKVLETLNCKHLKICHFLTNANNHDVLSFIIRNFQDFIIIQIVIFMLTVVTVVFIIEFPRSWNDIIIDEDAIHQIDKGNLPLKYVLLTKHLPILNKYNNENDIKLNDLNGYFLVLIWMIYIEILIGSIFTLVFLLTSHL